MAKHLLASVALCALAALPLRAEDAPTADTVVAKVNGTNITLGSMIALRSALPAQYQSLPDDVLFKGILDQIVQQELLKQSLPQPMSKKDTLTIENEARGYLSNEALKAVVESAVTDQALQAAYDAKYKNVAPGTEYHAAHILVDSEDKAKDLKAQIDGGADFAELAKANSSDGAAQNGGDLGWFGTGMMVKPFEDAVVTMKPGEVMGPVKTDFGWHLIKLIETRPAQPPKLDDVRDELAQDIESKAVEDHIAKLTAAAKIEKPGEGIDPAILKDTTLLDK
ncbi:MAG: peptidylprolyl isomerase [Paracoccaceae bacterium]